MASQTEKKKHARKAKHEPLEATDSTSSWLSFYADDDPPEKPPASLTPSSSKKSKKRSSRKLVKDASPRVEVTPPPTTPPPPLLDMTTVRSAQARLETLEPGQPRAMGHVLFPAQEGAWLPVTDPRTHWRLQWDVVLLFCIIYVMLVTPFQIAFVSDATLKETFTAGSPPGYNRYVVLFCVNLLVDIAFAIDILCLFNQGYFDKYRDVWVVDRRRIAYRYARGWLAVDALSVVPYGWLELDRGQGLVKVAKCLRLLKLMRMAKQPRIMRRLTGHITLTAGQQAILKYSLLIWFLLHWSACAIRLIALILRHGCENEGNKFERLTEGECPHIVLAPYWDKDLWSQYAGSLLWALSTLQGGYETTNLSEVAASLILGILGLIVIAFLVGDLCNIVSNMDPVGNEYMMTMDTLNHWLEEKRFPHALRVRLREYMVFAERAFRDQHNKEMLDKLSPGLRAVVAQHSLSMVVTRISFYVRALKRLYLLDEGRRVRVFPRHEEKEARPAVIVAVDASTLDLVVTYRDDDSVERHVPYTRVDVSSLGDDEAIRLIHQHQHQHDAFVLAMSRLFETKVYMPADVLVASDHSFNDELFVVNSGRVILWGERSVNPITSFRTCNVHDTIGDDICMLAVGSRTPRTRHYTARASTVTELATLDGNAFAELMDSGRFATFHRHVKAYGVWQILRNVVIKHVRECAAARSESRRVKHHSNFGVDKRGASAFDVDRSADLAADLIRKLATFLAAPKRERAQALKESAGGTPLLRVMEALGHKLDGHKATVTSPMAVAVPAYGKRAQLDALDEIPESTWSGPPGTPGGCGESGACAGAWSCAHP